MIIWVFVILILTSSYTATLTSMMTIHQIQLNTKGAYVGSQDGPSQNAVINLNFKGVRTFPTPEQYVDAFSKGGISAIIDEIPYIKIFLGMYPGDYSMIKSMSTTNGFGFVSDLLLIYKYKITAFVCESARACAHNLLFIFWVIICS